MRFWLTLALVLLAAPATAQLSPGPIGEPEGTWRGQLYWLPTADDRGIPHLLQARVCRPQGEAPARVVVVAHGLPVSATERAHLAPQPCDGEAGRWFLERGYVVVFALRRGFGASGGEFVEAPANGVCEAPDFAGYGAEAARDIGATVDFATELPFARKDGAVVVGQSTGGWGTIAYNAVAHPRVVAIVNMAGGTGGRRRNQPNLNCLPDRLAFAAEKFGRRATTPMLWIYARNDTFFPPSVADKLYRGFTRGGGKAEFERVGAFHNEGHNLFYGAGGSQIWGPLVERYLRRMDAL